MPGRLFLKLRRKLSHAQIDPLNQIVFFFENDISPFLACQKYRFGGFEHIYSVLYIDFIDWNRSKTLMMVNYNRRLQTTLKILLYQTVTIICFSKKAMCWNCVLGLRIELGLRRADGLQKRYVSYTVIS